MSHLSRTGVLSVALLAVAFCPTLGWPAEDDESGHELLELNREMTVAVVRGRDLELRVRAGEGDDYGSLARRFAEGQADALEAWNREAELEPGGWARIPLDLLSEEYRALVLRRLFPRDRLDANGDWLHVARDGEVPTYDEGLWQVARWFTGDGDGYRWLMEANGLDSPELRKGQTVRVPEERLISSLHRRLRSDDGVLEYGTDADGAYATYRLQPGEALYSAVVVRFTGRTGAEDVGEITAEVARRSGIRDLRDIPVGYEVKVPLALLEPEFLPPNHPRRVEADARRDELARQLEREPPAGPRHGLEDVLVIIDPGHGGRDLGTMNNGVWEHDYVYDVACRLRQKLATRSSADTLMTLIDAETGCRPSTSDKLVANRQGTIQTAPPFLAVREGEAQIGVNLRWYLANSVYRREVENGRDKDRIVFLSLHADARHPSLRGVMVYLPGAGYRAKTYGSTSKVYTTFKEVREKPHVSFSRQQRLRSEAISSKLADRIVESFEGSELPVQPYQPVRDKVIRGRSQWVPAVLRGNAIPTKALVELVNLSNPEDAKLLSSARERDRLAEALMQALLVHFGEDPSRIASRAP